MKSLVFLAATLLCYTVVTVKAANVTIYACQVCKCYYQDLDCSHRNLTHHLNDSSIEGFKFNDVIFDRNSIVHLKPFPVMTASKLSFRHNGIASIDVATFRAVKNLTEIDLSHNHLTSHDLIPHIFMGSYSPLAYEPLSSLKVLRLSGNSLHTLHQDLFEHLPNLRHLSLDSNPFKLIDRPTSVAVGSLLKLQTLDLSSTQLSGLPPTFLHTPRYLDSLNLSSNQFKVVPPSLGESEESLRELILDNNPILEIRIFPSLKNLEVLHMNDMPKLAEIGSGALQHLANLKELSITHSPQLTSIAEDAFSGETKELSWPPLSKLFINNNRLGYLGQGFVARWDHLTELDVSMNPWICDCENQWFLSTLMPHFMNVNKKKAIYMMCEEPTEMRGRLLMNLTKTGVDMRCLDSRGSRPEQDSLVLVAILIGLLMSIPLAMASFAFYQRVYGNASPLVRFSYHRASFVDTIS
ncbi:leucine-rich repeat transmembrane protein FLRT1-like [Rhodnius prolixus]|uniref:LRRCT domain-containing protein n=2 Tax=Rhodnius prolixus TaxID=13249 RepID=T1IG52_RHOPR